MPEKLKSLLAVQAKPKPVASAKGRSKKKLESSEEEEEDITSEESDTEEEDNSFTKVRLRHKEV